MTTKERVLEILLENSGYHSGEELAQQLGISRNSVWKAVRALRTVGFNIDAATNKGYALLSENGILSETVIRRYLPENDSRKIIVLEKVDSTNNYAKQLASKGAAHGTLVTAEIQTSGKGRFGRNFCSPKCGSIYMSVILRPDTDMESSQLLTSCIATAAAEALDKVCGTDVKVKWVNDLFLNGKKICGILTEASLNFENGRLEYAVAGIGINLRSIKNTFPEELLSIATSIEDETGKTFGRCRIIAEILKNIDSFTAEIEKKTFLDEYRRRSFIIGKRIVVSKYKEERMAQAVGIDESAGLVVRYDDGTMETLNSGEARILPGQ